MGNIFLNIRRIELIKKEEFAAIVFDLKYKTFIVYIITFNINPSDKVHPLRRVEIAYLKVDKTLTKVLSKYTNIVNNFLSKLAIQLFEYTGIINHAIKLVDD